MPTEQPISLLMFGTLIAVVIIAAIVLGRFMSKPRNQHPMDGKRERNIDEIRENGPVD